MSFGNAAAIQADVLFRADYAQFEGDTAKIRESAQRTYGVLDEGALKAALASEKYDRALARSRGSSYAVARATAAYKTELASIAAAEERASAGSNRHSGALRQEERTLSGVARGALAGSGALGHLGRAAIFASSSLLGGYGLIYALRSTIAAAQEQEVATAHAQVSLKNAGLSWRQYGADIEAALGRQIKATGFTDHELTETFARFVRRFGDINQALRANAIAADVAREKNISLAAAADLVERASFGNPRALRTLDIQLTKTTSHVDALKATTAHATAEQIRNAKAADQQASSLSALNVIAARYAGSAAKFLQTDPGKVALFNAQLDKTREIVGTALLPTFNEYLTKLTDYLEKIDRSGQLQHDVNEVMKTGKEVVHDLGDAIHFVDGITGGFKNTLELLLALKVATTLAGWRSAFVGMGASADLAAAGPLVRVTRSLRTLRNIGVVSIAFRFPGLAAGLAALLEVPAAITAIALAGPLLSSGAAPNVPGLPKSGPNGPDAAAIVAALMVQGKIPHDVFLALAKQAGVSNTSTVGAALQNKDFISLLYAWAQANGLVTAATAAGGAASEAAAKAAAGGSRTPSPTPGTTRGGAGGGGHGGVTVGLNYDEQNKLLEAEATPGTGDDERELRNQISILDRQLAQKGLTGAQRNQILSERNSALSQLQTIQQDRKQSEAKAARDEALRHKRLQEALQKQRRKRIQALEEPPVELRIAEANARAHNASEQTILKILKEERAALEEQVATLKKIGASKDDILKARQNEARIQAKINALTKSGGNGQNQAFIDSLSGVLGQFASDVGIGGKSGAKVIHVHVDQRGQEPSLWAAARAAREAAMHVL